MKNNKKIVIIIGLFVFIVLCCTLFILFKGTSANDEEKITYEMFGAKGDGVTNDYVAIKATHDYANKQYIETGVLPTIYACESNDCSDKTYYLGSSDGAGEIKIITNVDWGNANFIVDDYIDLNDDDINDVITTDNLFNVVSLLRIFANSKGAYIPFLNYDDEVLSYLSSNKMIKPNTSNLKYLIDAFYNGKIKTSDFYNNNKEEVERYFKSSQRWALVIINSNNQFIRKGINEDNGIKQTEIIILDGLTGDVLTDINWEYDDITEIKLWPISDNQITVGNGNFTTYTNNVVYTKDSSGNAKRNAFSNRNITLFYSGNVKLHNIKHYIDEDKHPYTNKYQDVSNGNRYYGFIKLLNSAYVDIANLKLSAHTPVNIVSNNKITWNAEGTYDLVVDNSANVFIDNVAYACNTYNSSGAIDYNSCYKKNVIDESKWAIMASNLSKNVFFTNSTMNKIDAHKNVTNLYVADSTIGVAATLLPTTLIGNGYFYGKNLKIDSANSLITLRDDYGSTWDGTIVLDNINYIVNKNSTNPSIIYSNNEENWDFGYTSYFPNVYINGLNIDTATNGANNVDYVTFLDLSDLYDSGSTVDKSNSRNLYNFKGNIYLNNLTTNGNEVRLFREDFVDSNTDTLSVNNYGGSNVVNLYLDNNVIVDSEVTSHSNPKFKVVDSMQDKTQEVSSFFTNLQKTSKMPSSLKPLLGKINLSSGEINEVINSNKFNYTANVNVDSITIELETFYVGTNTSWKTKTVDLNNGDNVLDFSVMNPNGDSTEYTLNIIKESDETVASNINTLDNITLSNGKLNETFDKSRNDYSANIDSDSVTITVDVTDENSKVTGDIGYVKLHYGTNNLNIVVTAEDGSVNKYVLNIYRKYNFSSDIYVYSEEDNYIYTGSDVLNDVILGNIALPSELSKNIENNKLIISYENENILEINILNISSNKYRVLDKEIKIVEDLSLGEFISNMNISSELTYKIFNSNEILCDDDILEDGMILKIYYKNNELDSYNISTSEYSLSFDPNLKIDEENKFIKYLDIGTTISLFFDKVHVFNGSVNIYNKEGIIKNNNEEIVTGDKLYFYSGDKKIEEYILSVLGDTNGDGSINGVDLVMLRKHIVEYKEPETGALEVRTGVFKDALDLSGDGVINSLDIVLIRKKIVGLS